MEELTQSQIDDLTGRLQELAGDLVQQLDRGEASAATVQLDQTLVGRVSRMDAMQQQSVAVSTLKRASQRLQRVNAALKAVTENNYGFCRRCDEPIGYKGLEAQPEANLCINCQDKADNQ